MSNENQMKVTATSVNAMAAALGIDRRTLREMIRLTPELQQLVQPYADEGKRLLPKAIVEAIYNKLGYPDE
jgi:hypothetical protein